MVSSTAVVYRYVRDDAARRAYKRMFLKDDPSKELVPQLVIVPVSRLVPSEVGSAGQRHHKHRAVPVTRPLPYGGRQGSPVTPAQSTPSPTPQPAPVRSYSALQDEKQGKMPNIIQFERSCPVN